MITKKELEFILQEGEGYKVEFKESLGDIAPDLAAFANSSGGKILLGIRDNGEAKGIEITNSLKSQVQNLANSCEPKVKILFEEVGNVLVIEVREGEDKPYKCSSGFYRRMGPNTQKLTRNEIIDLFKSEGKVKFDNLTEPKLKYPKDFDKEELSRFLELAGVSKSIKIENALVQLGVAEKQEGILYFNNAGVLFFAREPQRFVPWSVFTVVLFKDYEGADVIDRKEITGSLFEIVYKVMDFVKLYAKVAYRFTGKPQREEIYEYPFEAAREAVINSVMHKDYFESGHNNILKFFPDRIQIENIWVKPRNFILGKTVFRRNQLISDLFSRIHFGEKLGSGMQRMKIICKAENAPRPKIEFTDTHFYITFKQSDEYLRMAGKESGSDTQKVGEKVTERVVEKVGEKVTENQMKILKEINKDGFMTAEKLSEIIGISERKIQENIRKLKQKGLIGRIGPDKGGHWQVIE